MAGEGGGRAEHGGGKGREEYGGGSEPEQEDGAGEGGVGFSGTPPWRQPRGKLKVSVVNSRSDATRFGCHLLEIDSSFTPASPQGGCTPRPTAGE